MIGSFTLDQLRILVAIADTGSFSAASRYLNRAQSSISQAVATLEHIQGVLLFDRSSRRPQLTNTGRALVEQARSVLKSAARFEAIAASTKSGVEAELAIAIDPLVPTDMCIESLHALNFEFPHLTLSFYTEGLGGAERRLRRGDVALAFCTLLPSIPEDFIAYPLTSVELVPVAAKEHPLAQYTQPISLIEIDEHIQLVLSDPYAIDGSDYGILSTKKWRFVELSRRLDFLLSGLGWCRMPKNIVKPYIESGQLIALFLEDDPERYQPVLNIYAAQLRDRSIGRAASWLLNDLLARLS